MTETTPDTAIAKAFERAFGKGTDRVKSEDPRDETIRSLEDQVAQLYEVNRLLRVNVGELNSVVQAQRTQLEDAERRYDRALKVRDALSGQLANMQEKLAAQKNARRAVGVYWSREVLVYGFAFPDSNKPLPNHFGHSKREAVRFATLDDAGFRKDHDPDLELVECLVRIRPNSRRVPVAGFARKHEPEHA